MTLLLRRARGAQKAFPDSVAGPLNVHLKLGLFTPRRLIFWAAVLVVLAGFRGGLISGRAGDPGNGGQVPRGCFGHR